MSRRFVCIPFTLLLFSSVAAAQAGDDKRTEFEASLRGTTDSLVAVLRTRADTLFVHGDASTAGALALLGSCVDSLVTGAGDSLDGPGRIAIRTTELGMRTTLGVMGFPAKQAVRALLRSFEKELPVLAGRRSVCAGCTTRDQFGAALELFRDESDSLREAFDDSMSSVVESWQDALDDSVVAFTDSIGDRIGELKSENGEARESATPSHVVAGAGYETHTNYRGRDNGITESEFGPSLAYHHRTGLFAGGEVNWVSRTAPGPDNENLTAGYEFAVSEKFEGSVSYTHYWYSDSSTLPQSVTNQALGGTLSVDLDAVSFFCTLSYDFGGGGAEFTTSLDMSRDITIPARAMGGTVTLSPAAGATWGDQDERLLEKRLQRVKKKVVVVKSRKPEVFFGIMDYELSLPARFQTGRFSVEPLLEYVIPADVLNSGRALLTKDPSTTVPFLSFALTVSLTVE